MEGEVKEGRIQHIKNFLKNMARVLHVASKPSGEEYGAALKVTSMGIVLIGVIGFLIFVLFQFIGIL